MVSQKDLNMNIIVEAKQQYTKQLMNILKPIVFDILKAEYQKAINSTTNKKEILYNFQTNLKEIQRWNSDIVKKEAEKLLDKCKYFNDVITAVFVSNIRILTSVKVDKSKKKLKITIPSNETFIHKVYMNSAKFVFNNPYLFKYNKQGENVNEIHKLIEIAIDDTITELLPIQNILETYLGGNMVESDEDLESEEEEEEEGEGEYEDVNNEEVMEEPKTETRENQLETAKEIQEHADFFDNPDLHEEIKTVSLNDTNTKPNMEGEKTMEKSTNKESFFDDVED